MGPVPEQVLPGTSTGPLNKVNPTPFTLDGAGISGGGTPRPPGQEDPDPSPQRVQGPGGLRPGQAGRVLKNLVFGCFGLKPLASLAPWPPWPPPGPPGPPDPPGPPGPPGPSWLARLAAWPCLTPPCLARPSLASLAPLLWPA